ncbi:MAG TPA: XRE family transcriptional regulator [Pyrinomonadaceae bacterium]
MNFGEFLRKTRRERNLSQRALAAQLGMEHSHLCRIESGARFPKQFVPALANFLGVQPSELLKIIYDEKINAQVGRINEEPFLPLEVIESIAERDRLAFLNSFGRSYFRFPKDNRRIPKLLCGLSVEEASELFSRDDKQIFAGLFLGEYTYQGKKNVIVVENKYVKEGPRESTSDETQTFQILHEVGHYQLHWTKNKGRKLETQFTDRPLYCSSGDTSRREYQANQYASAFLMPRRVLQQEMDSRKSFNMRKDGRRFCEQFFVERWMLERRLRVLGIRIVD